jgi:hypothetical protein
MTPVLQTAVGLAIPFVGTALGAAAVFLFKSNIPPRRQKLTKTAAPDAAGR